MFPFDVENSRFSGFKMVQAEVDVDELSPSHSRNLGFDQKNMIEKENVHRCGQHTAILGTIEDSMPNKSNQLVGFS